ncbi:MAG: cytochrome c4 [Pseudomonadales bacterium]|nr:cytochrome c4 [Pseudomonadales bacterium]
MKKLILSVLMMAAAGSAMATGNAEAGKNKAAQCSACHGADGNSPAAMFPKLAGQHEKYIIKQLNDVKKKPENDGRSIPEMAGIVPGLSDQDIADIAAYYSAQTIKGETVKADLKDKGEAVYRGGSLKKGTPACTGCHGPSGKGNKGAGYPALAGQHAAYIEKQLKAFRLGADEPKAQGARVNDGDSRIMRDVTSGMTDYEIRAVASFISGLR